MMRPPIQAYIDHTLLKAEATAAEVVKLCAEAMHYQFAAACVSPVWVELARGHLKDSKVKLCSVVGFPLGTNCTEVKAAEAYHLAQHGVEEIDMVLHVGALKDKDYAAVVQDIQMVVQAAKPAIVKVIIEACLLTDEEKHFVAQLCVQAGASYVKTSTGFSIGGATLHDVALLRAAVGPDFGVKASGGIRDRATALAMIDAGATRLGTSAGIAIVEGPVTAQEFY